MDYQYDKVLVGYEKTASRMAVPIPESYLSFSSDTLLSIKRQNKDSRISTLGNKPFLR